MSQDELRERFVHGMSHAAATVNIVSTDGPAGRAGVTVSAMASVSADGPAPTMLVCVHHLSAAAERIIENNCFVVNILRDDQSYISDTFAGRREARDNDKFSCVEWTEMTTGAPRVVDPLVAFDCKLLSADRVGTHYIFVGGVQDVFAADAGGALIFANRAYGAAEKIYPYVTDPAEREEGALHIGALFTFGPHILPKMIRKLQDERGPITVDLFEGDQRKLMELLRSGDIDLALLYDLDLGDDLLAEPLMNMPPYVLMAPDHPLADSAELSLKDLADHPAVLLDAPPSREYFLSLFAHLDLTPNIVHRPWGFEMARGMVANGLGYCLMATRPAADVSYDGLPVVVRELTDNLPPSRMVMVRRKGELPTLAEEFSWFCRDTFGTDLD